MTTSSGKPPFDEQALDSSWDAGSDAPTGGPDSSSREPLTPRQPATAPRAADAAASPTQGSVEPAQVYGTVVPYGGDDHTEEIDPVALDMPFTPEERQTPAAPVAATPRAPAAGPARGYEMKAHAQVLLSDLFDSVPSSGAMAPPDPAAFSSSRPPPPERPPSDPPPPGRDAIIALPNINIGSEAAQSAKAPAPQPRPEPEVAHRSSPRAPMPTPPPSLLGPSDTSPSEEVEPQQPPPQQPPLQQPQPGQRSFPVFEAVQQRPDVFDPEMSTATVRLTPHQLRGADPEMSTATLRLQADRLQADRSQPDPEMSTATVRLTPDLHSVDPEMSTATIKLSRDMLPALGSSPSQSRPSNAPPRAPMPSSPAPGEAVPGELAANGMAGASPAAPSGPPSAALDGIPSGDVAHFPSEVATSRPPDVALAPNAGATRHSNDPRSRASREPKPPPQATVATPASSQFKPRDASLPSIMLAADVEAEPDSAARRALRAARATVRLELPPGFGRPGSPVGSTNPVGAGPGGVMPAAASPSGHAAPAAVGSFVPSSVPVLAKPEPWFANARAKRLIGAGLAGLVLFVTLIFALGPRTGSLVVTALAPGNRAVDDVTIFIDGRPLCDVSPCRIKGLTPGMHSLRASAPNLASQAEETVEITAGDEATYNIDLLGVAPEVRGGGMRLPAAEVPLTLFVDGKRVGKLPQEVSGLSAGKHWIKLDPEDGSSVIEKSVNVLAGEIVEVEPKAAKRDKALVTIRLGRGSEGAQVTFDEAFLLDFPAEMELEPNTVHTLEATKPGYEDLSLDVEVAAGEKEKLVEVSLTPLEGNRKNRPAKVARKPATKPAATTASTALADATQGLLNISSTPPSQIILNGRPLGSTPKTGIMVPGDSLQTIVFVHPKMGRRRAQKFVPAGKERTVSIRF